MTASRTVRVRARLDGSLDPFPLDTSIVGNARIDDIEPEECWLEITDLKRGGTT